MATFDIAARLWVDWDRDTTYTDESAYLVSARGAHRLAPPGQSITATSGRVAECTVVLDNASGRFSSHNTGGALYSHIGSGKAYQVPMYLEISVVAAGGSASYYTVFTGVARIPSEQTLAPGQPKTISLDCRGVEDTLLNRRQRTTQADFATWQDDGVTEAGFIDAVLDDSGTTLTTDLDDGLFALPWAWLDNEAIVEELWKAATACGGRFYATASGVLAYENATHWLLSPHTTSVDSYARDADFGSLELLWDETELAEEVSVTWAERETGESETIYDSDNVIVPAGESVTLWADFDNPVYAVDSLTFTAGTAGGADLSADIAITPTYYAQSAKLVIASTATVQAAVRVVITGREAIANRSQTVVQTSADSFWTAREGRSRKVSGNRYVQSSGQANFLKAWLADRQETPTLVAKLRGCPGVPQRRLGDRITVADSELNLSSTDFYITAVTWQYGTAGYRQDIEAARCSDLFAYAGGGVSGGYFVLGTGNNTLGSASSKPGKLFY